MLLQLVIQQPQMLGTIVRQTPPWVWGLLAFLIALGLSQVRQRRVHRARVAILPIAMTGLSLASMWSSFGASPWAGGALVAWLAAVCIVLPLAARGRTQARRDAATGELVLPGSWAPLVLILCIFLTRYVVGIELALQPTLARDAAFILPVAGLYGVFTGMFAGRAVRLWRTAGGHVRQAATGTVASIES